MSVHAICPYCRYRVPNRANICGTCRQELGWFEGLPYPPEQADSLRTNAQAIMAMSFSSWPWAWHLGLGGLLSAAFLVKQPPASSYDVVTTAGAALLIATGLVYLVQEFQAKRRLKRDRRDAQVRQTEEVDRASVQVQRIIASKAAKEAGPFALKWEQSQGDQNPDSLSIDNIADGVIEAYGAEALQLLDYEGHWRLVHDDVESIIGPDRVHRVLRQTRFVLQEDYGMEL